jgi:predicted metal-binding protein
MTKRIVVVACRKLRQQNLCPGDAKCLVAMMKREGEFERYKGEEASIVGIVECGECHGERVPASLALLKMQLAALKETADVVHVGTCIALMCRYKDDLLNLIKEKAGVEVVEGTHKYVTPKVFP